MDFAPLLRYLLKYGHEASFMYKARVVPAQLVAYEAYHAMMALYPDSLPGVWSTGS